jgi:hypothetical protein
MKSMFLENLEIISSLHTLPSPPQTLGAQSRVLGLPPSFPGYFSAITTGGPFLLR